MKRRIRISTTGITWSIYFEDKLKWDTAERYSIKTFSKVFYLNCHCIHTGTSGGSVRQSTCILKIIYKKYSQNILYCFLSYTLMLCFTYFIEELYFIEKKTNYYPHYWSLFDIILFKYSVQLLKMLYHDFLFDQILAFG